ncbi:MAG: VIT1/CCC1 transporter family protein [Bacteroidota bacterium]|nr:VIT1/CCC1 transporter family protein [Bacteroidota bacterium]
MTQHSDHHHHNEYHSKGSETIQDIVIGMSDGLTVPFALAAGISGAVNTNDLVITAGLAEIAAGAIAMGLGGYLAAKSAREHYLSERKREEWEVIHKPQAEEDEIILIMAEYGVSAQDSAPLVNALKKNHKAWVDFMMRFELGLDEPHPKRSFISGATIAGSYIAGGLVPMAPYFFTESNNEGLYFSILTTGLALIIFGFFKGRATGVTPWKSSLQTFMIGGAAAGAAYFIAFQLSR